MADEDSLFDENDLIWPPSSETEDEEDLRGLDRKTLLKAFVSSSDWTTETILNQLKRGNIILNVRYQRRDAWKPERKSKFIESLILGFPVPQLVLAEAKKTRGTFIVIDGKQRLLSIRQFAAKDDDQEKYEQLKLTGLEIRKDLNGKTLSDLEEDPALNEDLKSFQNETIRTVVVRNWPGEDYLYAVFLRLNTGSVKLSPQELRQALRPGKFIDFVDDRSSKSIVLQKILRIDKPDFRMRDVELLVRYYAFRNFINDYKGNLKAFLDLTCERLNGQWDNRQNQILQQADEFEESLNTTHEIFKENAFRKWAGNNFEGRFNRAVFDIMVFYFVNQEISKASKKHMGTIIKTFKELCINNDDFRRSIETTTKSIDATGKRLYLWGEALSKAIGIKMSLPKLENNRIIYRIPYK